MRWLKDRHDPVFADWKTFIKTELLRDALAKRPLGSFGPAIEKLRKWCQWNDAVKQTLIDRHNEGHQIVIISGALDIYLPELLKELPSHTLICTTMAQKNGVLTGELAGDNCVRAAKAFMLKNYLAEHEELGESWGYGNAPDDLPMLNLLTHRIII